MGDVKPYPGIVCLRELPEGLLDWEKVEKNLKSAFGFDVVRLHLELMREHPEDMDTSCDGRPILVLDDKLIPRRSGSTERNVRMKRSRATDQ